MQLSSQFRSFAVTPLYRVPQNSLTFVVLTRGPAKWRLFHSSLWTVTRNYRLIVRQQGPSTWTCALFPAPHCSTCSQPPNIVKFFWNSWFSQKWAWNIRSVIRVFHGIPGWGIDRSVSENLMSDWCWFTLSVVCGSGVGGEDAGYVASLYVSAKQVDR